jgi:sugar phosphate isomerase/epimerase
MSDSRSAASARPSGSPSTLALGAITFRDRPFEQILSAAAGAGFDGIGLTVGQCVSALERGIALDQIPERLTAAGLRVAELELIRLVETGPVPHVNGLVLELAGMLGPDRVHVAAWHGDRSQICKELADVCSALPDTPVAFEFMAYNAVPGFTQAVELAEQTGAPNAAVVLDILHFFRTGSRFDELTEASLQRVAVVQLSDVVDRPRGDALDEARHRRTCPGEGTLDSVSFLRRVLEVAPMPPISVEPINDAYEALPLGLVADRAMVATARLLARARG